VRSSRAGCQQTPRWIACGAGMTLREGAPSHYCRQWPSRPFSSPSALPDLLPFAGARSLLELSEDYYWGARGVLLAAPAGVHLGARMVRPRACGGRARPKESPSRSSATLETLTFARSALESSRLANGLTRSAPSVASAVLMMLGVVPGTMGDDAGSRCEAGPSF